MLLTFIRYIKNLVAKPPSPNMTKVFPESPPRNFFADKSTYDQKDIFDSINLLRKKTSSKKTKSFSSITDFSNSNKLQKSSIFPFLSNDLTPNSSPVPSVLGPSMISPITHIDLTRGRKKLSFGDSLNLVYDGPAAAPGATAPVTVLTVDDSVVCRKALKRMLESEGFIVYEAKNGKECFDKIDKVSIDIIFMDDDMPIMDGKKAAFLLRKNGYTKIIIGLTGEHREEEHNRYIECGADAVFTKPLNINTLRGVINVLSASRGGGPG
jgi:CheY-like chemotaxis protein